MVQWSCNLQPSRLLLYLALLLHALLALAVCLLPGMGSHGLSRLFLLAGIGVELIFTWQRLWILRGEFQLTGDGGFYWDRQRYTIHRQPLLLSFALAIPLRCSRDGRQSLLWLARESMSPQQWRLLRMLLLQQRAR